MELNSKTNEIKDIIKSKALINKIESLNQNQLDSIQIRAKKIRISLVMLTKNQAGMIQQVLEKIKLLNIDEYIVVDTGSTDGTVEILKKMEYVKLRENEWVEDYSLMRNTSSTFSDADWILTMDSDELLLTEHIDLKFLIAVLEEICDEEFAVSFEQYSLEETSYEVPSRLYNPNTSKYFGLVHEELRSKASNKPIKFVLTRIKIRNAGTTDKEVQKFSKRERYSKLLRQMLKEEPDNPRWFALTSEDDVKAFVQDNTYEMLLIKYIFKHSKYVLSVDELNENVYVRMLIEKYVAFLIISERFEEAKKLCCFSLDIYPLDVCLQFYHSYLQIVDIKKMINNALKDNLKRYLSFDIQEVYDYNYRDTQLLELILAELNYLKGNSNISEKIIQQLNDKNALSIWKNWHEKF